MKSKSKLPAIRRRSDNTQAKKNNPIDANGRFLVAAIGASAGGIEAFSELVRHLPANTGMAFVLIQHLDPKHHSILTELLARETEMPVKEVTDGMRLEPNHVYVIPPNATMSLSNHTLQLGPRGEVRGAHMPIDHFMRTLAEGQGNCAIGVVLSGSGTDGTLGLAEIQAQGGVTFAQDEASAKYDSMPRSAVGHGCVDYILRPKGIARELTRIARHPYVQRSGEEPAEILPTDQTALKVIFQLLRRSTGVDFTHYRQTTILRRIQRRMVVHKINKITEYAKYVQTNPSEIKQLYQDMLINVTSFFRNPSVFEAIKSHVFAGIFKNRRHDATVRIWTPGCATGEETYSVAIALLEYLGEKASEVAIQLFGTDVSEASIGKARTGVYPENIQGDVSAERLRRFFTKTEGGYRVNKTVRDVCIFAQHNLLNDPPFSQMDLICCRNLLIYLEPVLQSKVISLFHYAAKPGGYLVLGSSEGVGTVANLFNTEDRAHKIFSKKPTTARPIVTFSLNRQVAAESGSVPMPTRQVEGGWNYLDAQKEFDRRLLAQYAPATAFVNEEMEIVHTRGNVSRYLKLAPGRASLNIMKMAREGLLFDLRGAFNRAKKENITIRRQGVETKVGNGNGNGNVDDKDKSKRETRYVNFEVVPLRIGNGTERYFMILFYDSVPTANPARSRKAERETPAAAARIAKLEQELTSTKEYLQSVIETQEATNEELQSANEEILSSNEELQSTNEELETAKEELQSANEELSTVNDELRSRNVEVMQINNDLTNLLSSIDLAVVMVGSDLTIRRFTPLAQKMMGLIPGDIGRPFLNVNPAIEIEGFQPMVLQVISTSRPAEKEFADSKGRRFQLRILPYRTIEGKVDGAVITLGEESPKE
jgi:two-component system, chemotaxis family, CheB/CheR fusion protein